MNVYKSKCVFRIPFSPIFFFSRSVNIKKDDNETKRINKKKKYMLQPHNINISLAEEPKWYYVCFFLWLFAVVRFDKI